MHTSSFNITRVLFGSRLTSTSPGEMTMDTRQYGYLWVSGWPEKHSEMYFNTIWEHNRTVALCKSLKDMKCWLKDDTDLPFLASCIAQGGCWCIASCSQHLISTVLPDFQSLFLAPACQHSTGNTKTWSIRLALKGRFARHSSHDDNKDYSIESYILILSRHVSTHSRSY